MSSAAFRASIGEWADATDEQLLALARGVCFAMGQRVVQNTPVDTGFLRGSWQPSLTGKVSEGDADPSGASVIAAIGLVTANLKLGDTFSMRNGASYGWMVEAGTSKMPGQHFTSDTVASFPAILADEAADLGMTRGRK